MPWYKRDAGVGLRENEKPNYPVVSGRQVFEERSITGLNRLPVVIHANAINKGATEQGTDPTVPEITERVLVDGTLLDVGGVIRTNILAVRRPDNETPGSVVEVFPRDGMDRPVDIHRHWYTLDGIQWFYQDMDKTGALEGQPTLVESDVRVIWNGTGILEPTQWTYRRLEQIENSVRRLQTGAGLKTILHGMIRNIQQTKDALNDEGEDIAVVSGDTKVDRATSTNQIDKLESERKALLALYYQAVNITDTTYQPDRPSGADRQLQLAPQARFIEAQREIISRVMREWYGVNVEFSQLHTASVQDRTMEYQLLVQLRDAMVITAEEFSEKAKKLS